MSNTKHTPGPWEVCTSLSGYRTICGENYKSVAVISRPESEDFEANAKLISASPDGLSLAEHIMSMADDAYLSGHPEWGAIVDEAKAYYKKATE